MPWSMRILQQVTEFGQGTQTFREHDPAHLDQAPPP